MKYVCFSFGGFVRSVTQSAAAILKIVWYLKVSAQNESVVTGLTRG